MRGHRSESAFSPFSALVGLEARGLGPAGERGIRKGKREFGRGRPPGSRRRSEEKQGGCGRWPRRGRLPGAPSDPGQGPLKGVDQPAFDSGSPNPLCSVLPGGHVPPLPLSPVLGARWLQSGPLPLLLGVQHGL